MLHNKGIAIEMPRPEGIEGHGMGRRLPSLSRKFWKFLFGKATFLCTFMDVLTKFQSVTD